MQSSLESTLAQLVAIPSVSGTPAACHAVIEYVRGRLEASGLFITSDTDRDSPWLIATTQNTKEPDIMFAAHLDVVPAEASMFTMQKQDAILTGRGVYDMKFAAACYIELIRYHMEELRTRNIGFLFTTDEEVNSESVPAILERGWRPKIVFLPDGGDNWHIEEQAKGLYGVEIIVRGTAAHGSRPWEGDNALHRLMDILHELRKEFPHQNPNDATLAVNEVKGGTAVNQIADYAAAKIDFRSFHMADLELFRQKVESYAATHALEVHVNQEGSPVRFDNTVDTAKDFLMFLEKITGEPARYAKSYGASDGRFFAQYDIPSILIQPRGGGRHSKDEWLHADDLVPFYTLIKEWALLDK